MKYILEKLWKIKQGGDIDEPIVSRKKIIEKTGIKFTTLVGVINAFQEKQILIETTGYSRNQVFAFQKYIIDLFLK